LSTLTKIVLDVEVIKPHEHEEQDPSNLPNDDLILEAEYIQPENHYYEERPVEPEIKDLNHSSSLSVSDKVGDLHSDNFVEFDFLEPTSSSKQIIPRNKKLRSSIAEFFPNSSDSDPCDTYFNYVRFLRDTLEDFIAVIAPEPTEEEENIDDLRREEERRIDAFLKNSRYPRKSSQKSMMESNDEKSSPYIPTESSDSSLEDFLVSEEQKIKDLERFNRRIEIQQTEGFSGTTSEEDELNLPDIRDKTPPPFIPTPSTPSTDSHYSSPNKDADKENKNVYLSTSLDSKVDKEKRPKDAAQSPFTPKQVFVKLREKVKSPRGEIFKQGSRRKMNRKDRKPNLTEPTKNVRFNDVPEEHTYQIPQAARVASRSPSPTSISVMQEDELIGMLLQSQPGPDFDYLLG